MHSTTGVARCTLLLIYGTLLHPGLRQALLGRAVAASAAQLCGYRRVTLRGQIFPAVVPVRPATASAHADSRINGALIRVSPRDLDVLDAYEGDFYTRRRVRVRTGAGEPALVWCYLLKPQHRRKTSRRAWSYQRFSLQHTARAIIEARGFRAATTQRQRG